VFDWYNILFSSKPTLLIKRLAVQKVTDFFVNVPPPGEFNNC